MRKFSKKALCCCMCLLMVFSAVVNGYTIKVKALASIPKVIAVSAAGNNTMVLKDDGTVWVCGSNSSGLLGNGTASTDSSGNATELVQVQGLQNIIAISAAGDHMVALRSDGTVWTWGLNTEGQLGNGTNTDSYVPVPVPGMNNVKAIYTGYHRTMVIKNDSSVWAWGMNDYGQLGDGSTVNRNSPVPVAVIPGTEIKGIALGDDFTLVLENDNTVWAWGLNSHGQLGDDTLTDSLAAVQIPTLSNIKSISVDSFSAFALTNDGLLWAWGSNFIGQLGTGNIEDVSSPVNILNNVQAIYSGDMHSFAVKNDNTVWAWGNNYNGQLGIGNNVPSSVPVEVSGLTDINEISAGGYHSAALKNDGTVLAWGCNTYGQLGNSNVYFNVCIPSVMCTLSDAESISADSDSLVIGYATGDSADSVTQNLGLPVTGANGTTISWSSTDTSVISAAGAVTRPKYTSGNADITLTATISKGSSSTEKTFNVTVIKSPISNAECVDIEYAALEIGFADGDSASNVTKNLNLPTVGDNGTGIQWDSSSPSVVSDSGVVNRPDYFSGNASITLTANIYKNGIGRAKYFNITVINNPITDDESVNLDENALDIVFIPGDSASGVTQDIGLLPLGPYGSTIRWTSSNPSVISDQGIVTRPSYTSGNADVTLTAEISKGSSSTIKTFYVIVIRNDINDAERLTFDKAALQILFADGDSSTSVTRDLTLPTSGGYGSAIVWTSTNPLIIANTGKVNRPSYISGDADVTLTAYISSGIITDTKTFNVTVIKNPITDAESVALDKQALAIAFTGSDTSSAVTQDLTLPVSGANGTTIAWTSGNPSVISASGKVNRPSYTSGDADVTLTAVITKGTSTDTKTFNVTVVKNPITDAESVTLDKQVLAIGFTGSDISSAVTQNITLPASGANGTTITWTSSNPSVISASGKVNRPSYTSGDADVTLTAVITKGTSTDTKVFKVTVIKNPITDAESVALDKQALAIGFTGSDISSAVTQNLTLPTSGTNGTTIVWTSGNPSVISTSGKVNRPSYTSGDADVTLTAAITKGTVTDTKVFKVTVIKNPITDADCSASDAAALTIVFADGDSASGVTHDITLPVSGASGSTITWTSSNPSVISASGKVSRPGYTSGDADITLTAVITKGNSSMTKVFHITVKAQAQQSPAVLIKTGSMLNFSTLCLTGLLLMLAGVLIIRNKKRNNN